MSQNSINNTIGSSTTNTVLSQLRSSSGQWNSFADGTDTHGYYSGSGTPEGVVAANRGSLYSDTGNVPTGVYYKTTDTVNTGWIPVAGGGSSGRLVGFTITQSSFPFTTTSIMGQSTNPTFSEGLNFLQMRTVHTPLAVGNRLIIEFSAFGSTGASSGSGSSRIALFQNATGATSAAVDAGGYNSTNNPTSIYLRYVTTATSTNSATFDINAGSNLSTVSTGINGSATGSPVFGTAAMSRLTVTELTP